MQLDRLNGLLDTILPDNRFYADKLNDASLPLDSLDQLAHLPYTFKDELQRGSDDSPFAANRTYNLDRYSRFHRTSGTRGQPIVVLDTADDWQWWINVWQFVLDAAELTAEDRALMAFSFGPFIGFWSAHDATLARGALVVPTGGLSTAARIDLARTVGVTAVFCTPSYALHMAETAAELGIDLGALGVKQIIVAGEPGGSIPSIRQRIEHTWKAKVIDHSGATEVGPWGYPTADHQGLHIPETEFIAEFIQVETGQAAKEGELAELVLTTLGRSGSPVIRYRTGDLVRHRYPTEGPNHFVVLDGGVLGRVDDMMIIRGVNIFPSSIESILRTFAEVVEYRIVAHKVGEMDALTVAVEDPSDDPRRIAQELKVRLGLRVEVCSVPIGSLPRFEGKAKRFVDQRASKDAGSASTDAGSASKDAGSASKDAGSASTDAGSAP